MADEDLLPAVAALLKVELAKLKPGSERKVPSQHKKGKVTRHKMGTKQRRERRGRGSRNLLPGRSEPIVGEPRRRVLVTAISVLVNVVLPLLHVPPLLLLLSTVLGLGLVTVVI